jgi:hypothetical protein
MATEFLLAQLDAALLYEAYSEESLPVNVGLAQALRLEVARALTRSSAGVGIAVRIERMLSGTTHPVRAAASEVTEPAIDVALESRELAALVAPPPISDVAAPTRELKT